MAATDTLTVMEAIRLSADYFAAREVESARLSAEVLLAHVLGLERLQLYLQFDRPLSDTERDAYRELVRRRAQHEPVAYLVGNKQFYSLEFEVSPAVLIPRPETEHLVETVVEWCRQEELTAPRILDVGTGSGNIAIALLHELPAARAVGVDVEPAALAIAARNAERHGVAERLQLIEGDMQQTDWLAADAEFDVLVSNPPYVPLAVREQLMPDVREHEPAVALFGGESGGQFYPALARLAAQCLGDSALVAIELGVETAVQAQQTFEQAGWPQVSVREDLQQRPRVLRVQRKEVPAA